MKWCAVTSGFGNPGGGDGEPLLLLADRFSPVGSAGADPTPSLTKGADVGTGVAFLPVLACEGGESGLFNGYFKFSLRRGVAGRSSKEESTPCPFFLSGLSCSPEDSL